MQIDNKLKIDWENILIIWNRSYKNLGDELILLWTIKLLQKQKKKIFVQAYDPDWLRGFLEKFVDISDIYFLTEIPKGFRSIFRFFWTGKWRELRIYKKIDSIILGGGEILSEENPNSYWYRLISMFPVLKQKKKQSQVCMMWGIQIPKKNLNLKLLKKLLKHSKFVYARDFETVEELKNFGYKNVEFFMDTAYFAIDRAKVKKSKKKEKYIVVNLNKNGERFLEEIGKDIKIYAEKWYKFYYSPISKWSNPEYSDIRYFSKLSEKFEMEILDWEKDFEKFLEIIKWAEIVISARLHLFLIASFLGVPTKVYPYQKKILKMQNVIKKIWLSID